MQSRNGGWGSFDADNTHYYLNHIPFADHGALLDPPTADVSARCLGFLAQLGYGARSSGGRRRARLSAARAGGRRQLVRPLGHQLHLRDLVGARRAQRRRDRSATAPKCAAPSPGCSTRQRADGGWGEHGECYWPGSPHGEAPYSTASQTAWALLALMAAGEVDNPAVARGIAYLIATPGRDGNWDEPWYTAVGFPRVFYLRYHGYRAFFPLWALARYRRLSQRQLAAGRRSGSESRTPDDAGRCGRGAFAILIHSERRKPVLVPGQAEPGRCLRIGAVMAIVRRAPISKGGDLRNVRMLPRPPDAPIDRPCCAPPGLPPRPRSPAPRGFRGGRRRRPRPHRCLGRERGAAALIAWSASASPARLAPDLRPETW